MDKSNNYEVKDLKLAEQGEMNVEIAESHMGALLKIKQRFEKEKPLKGIKVGLALHITKETAVLVKTLISGGADVAITGCNPLSTQDDVAAALAKQGVNVWGYKGETNEDYYKYLTNVINFKPHITLARVKQTTNKIKLQQLLKSIKTEKKRFEVTWFKLKKSTLTKEGAKYEDLETYEGN